MIKKIKKYHKKAVHSAKSVLNDKKQLTYVAIITILVITVIVETAVIIRSNDISKDESQTIGVSSKPAADHLKSMAIEALNNKNFSQAKALFQAAQRQYEYIGDTNNVVDTEAQLYLIEHSGTSN